ncbi:hypothetical protein F5Y04DRAFT_274302 [Hypomontagnella monticulosa]|nr:hypothetical protein F5Y04DRAFT_274302 [Hypomontagnella monticulosa]
MSLATFSNICGVSGISFQLPYFTTIIPSRNYTLGCSTLCSNDSRCQTYAVGAGLCFHYDKSISTELLTNFPSPIKFYDQTCAPIKGALGPSSVSEAISSINEGSYPTTHAYGGDSPLMIKATGTTPFEKGLGGPTSSPTEPSCILDPNDVDDQFNILGSNFVPLVRQGDDKLQPLPAPTSEAEANAMGPPDDYPLPVFFFQKPDNAPVGVYDIALLGPSGETLQYVAMTSEGDVVLTTSSTGTTTRKENGSEFTTSIFGVECDGHITAAHGGSQYTWDISTDGTSTAFTASIVPSKKTMIAYSLRRKAESRRKLRIRNKYTEGIAPRCPKEPPGLVARAFPGARPPASNGCGPAKGFNPVPNFSFGSCCDAHDICYDDCENGTFEQCNEAFHHCMSTTGCDPLKGRWGGGIDYLACLKAADFYAWAVSTELGQDAFKNSTKERCGCYCPEAQGLCGRGDGNHRCSPINGTDVNNCGACGKVCPGKSTCYNGKCFCPNDQCDDLCVNLRNNANNCGACGKKCATGYCVEGKCKDPRTDVCVPVAIPNGDFSQDGDGWTACGRLCFAKKDDGVTFENQTAVFAINGNGELNIETNVKMCPEMAYELSLTTQRLSGNSSCIFKYQFGERDWSPNYDFSRDYGKHSMGPYNASAFQIGDFGTSSNGLGLDMKFTMVVVCESYSRGWLGGDNQVLLAVDDFDLAPAQ